MNARRAILLGRSKKVLTALLVAKCRRRGDSEDSVEQLIDGVHTEGKRQIAERVLGMVSFRDESVHYIDCVSLLESRCLAARPSRRKQCKL